MRVSEQSQEDATLMTLMKAWEAYKVSSEYGNIRKHAMYPESVDGSLWYAFRAGYQSRVHRFVKIGALWTKREYPCGCTASGLGDVPAYCAAHGVPPIFETAAAARAAGPEGEY